jgi:hypothetical protein
MQNAPPNCSIVNPEAAARGASLGQKAPQKA